jgi:hypothetical protein
LLFRTGEKWLLRFFCQSYSDNVKDFAHWHRFCKYLEFGAGACGSPDVSLFFLMARTGILGQLQEQQFAVLAQQEHADRQ